MPTIQELEQARVRAIQAKDREAAAVLTEEIAKARQESVAPSMQATTPIENLPGDPTQGMSALDLGRAGAGKAFADLARGLGQTAGLYSFNDAAEQQRLDAPLLATSAGNLGNNIGQVATALAPGAALGLAGRAAPFLDLPGGAAMERIGTGLAFPRTTAGAAGAGAVAGGMQPGKTLDERVMNAAGGAAVGAGVSGGANMIAGRVSPQARTLIDQGVNPTPGQMAGGWANRLEEGMGSIPLLGDFIRGGRRGAVEDFNRAVVNRSLSPIGESLPKDKVGREAIAYANERLSNAYQSILPRLRATVDGQFLADLSSAVNRAKSLPQDREAQVMKILQEQLGRRFQRTGQTASVGGEELKKVEAEIGRLAANYRGAQSADEREIGYILSDVQDSFRDLVQRSNPNDAPILQRINEGFSNFKRAQRASVLASASDGVFTPSQFNQAVKMADKSKDRGAYARGDARMQDIASAAKEVLGDKVPDSGTPYRAMIPIIGGGGAAMIDPLAGAALGLGSLAYTTPGRKFVTALAARRPAIIQGPLNSAAAISPYVTVPAAGASR